ncbi:exodeoxyribonuclease V subunit gamma [Chlamydia muridarum str. Nigg]|nr:exodeoxyribonuclease V subunit gamma [Chlamydia muridarum]UFU86863.1 exonuclease V subunit gamma [Chlamydia trachomatis]AHH22409.1 exodeoxyribonuclease V subunit gamma [Chlamydia muridarum str. Nigg3 CMUT3-5]AHH23333.1 exodeoxyribonuclease V subunit gamma [Chlamydia muridarum str. Nigg CM972]AID37561.1 exodeoxyribonuclease V subunit gamma [Chlamydia muridarum str. Nigg 2 MCR]AIT90255.1 exodeoxyribonuclease V subunit gamma [Chlamydia muridarum]
MNELSHSQATFSNYPEVLLAKLAQDLFSINQTPMTKRWILVPSSDTDHWLRRELVKASSNHIFMGTHIFASFDAFVKYLFTGTRLADLSTPDHITLPLNIYNLLRESSFNSSSDVSYAHLQKLSSLFKKFYTFSQEPSTNNPYYKNLFTQLTNAYTPLETIFSSILAHPPKYPCSLHIFGYPQLPQHVASFFISLGKYFPVHFYCFSPSAAYFGDLLSDKAMALLSHKIPEPQQETWEKYVLTDRLALLANLAHRSQSLQNFFLDYSVPYEELFQPYENNSSLNIVKDSFFHLRPIDQKLFADSPQTIFVRKAPSAAREVHQLFSIISQLLNSGVSTDEIFIVSSNLSKYEPLLKGIFEPHIPLYLTKSEKSQTRDLKNKLLLLVAFLFSKCTLHDLLKLLSYPDLRTPLETTKISFLTHKLSRYWKSLSQKDPLISQLIHHIFDEYPFIDDSGVVNESETWEIVVPLLDLLQQVITHYTDSKDKTYEEHSHLIFSTLENIFLLSTEEHALLVSLSKTLQPFAHSSCSLTIFVEFCLDFLSHIPGYSQLYNQPGPFIGSINSLSLIPKGYTFILGANKKNFSLDTSFLIDPSLIQEDFLFSSTEDEDNLHFLQTIVSTKHQLHISYLSSSKNPALPSSALKHLLDAVPIREENLSGKLYAKENFSSQSLHQSYQVYYRMAQADPIQNKAPSLFETASPKPLPTHLSLKHLVKAFKDPLNFFLNTQHGLSFHPKSLFSKAEKVFPSPYDAKSFWDHQLAPHSPLPTTNYLSSFTESLYTQTQDSIIQRVETLKKDPSTAPFSVVFSHQIFQEPSSPHDKYVPPFPLSLHNQTISLQGEIRGVCSQGVYLFSMNPGDSFKKATKSHGLPKNSFELESCLEAYLSLALLQASHILPKDSAILRVTPYDIEPITPPFSSPESYLILAVGLYEHLQNKAIPLPSAQAWEYIKKTDVASKIIKKLLDNEEDPLTNSFWLFHNRDTEEICSELSKDLLSQLLSLFINQDTQ